MDNDPSPQPPADRVPPSNSPIADHVLTYIHYFSPIVLLLLFLVVFIARSIRVTSINNAETESEPNSNSSSSDHSETQPLLGPGGRSLPQRKLTGVKRKQDKDADFPHAQKVVFMLLSILASVTFAASSIVISVHAVTEPGWWCGESVVVYQIGSLMVYMVLALSVRDIKPSPNAAQLSTWSLALLFEICRISAFLAFYGRPNLMDGWLVGEISINATRLVLLLCIMGLYVLLSSVARSTSSSGSVEESAALLQSDPSTTTTANDYGAVQRAQRETSEVDCDDQPGWARPEKAPSRGWWEYVRGYSVFFPYLWPSKDRKLQMTVVFCFTLVFAQRGFNVLVPYQLGVLTNILSDEPSKIQLPWTVILVYVTFRALSGPNSLINAVRRYFWIPVSQYSYRELSIASFEHVHSLSLDFHLGKKTGEVTSALGKGNAINSFLEECTFSIVPFTVDLVAAIVYFFIMFDTYYTLVVVIMTFWYIYFTIRLAKWRAEARREMTNDDRQTDAIKADSISSYETVKYFNAETHEFNRYRDAVLKYQQSAYSVETSLSFMNIIQNGVFTASLAVVCFIAARQVSEGHLTVGKFVSLLTYMAQLREPLDYFGTFYKTMQNSMINSERLLELFKEEPGVTDKPGVKDLETCNGDIRFNDVRFAYDTRKNALNGMDFHCKPGTTTAFVGESGGGKSTIFRLVYRFYNTATGNIEIDGKDVQDVTIDSVRRNIGVVPQDTVLFNDTLMYNLKYAKPGASDQDVYDACKAACIHDRIMDWPDQYETAVGERGLRLSGGEKQRIAIARTILRGSKIIMLDEATAALDTATEKHIQGALKKLSKGRTVLVIAHRLSTIANADQILVLQGGKVIERGNHRQLLEKNGHYKDMWQKQVEAQEAIKEARDLKSKAVRLRRESKGEATLEPYVTSSNETSDIDENGRSRRIKGKRAGSRHQEERNSDDDEQRLQLEALKMRHGGQ